MIDAVFSISVSYDSTRQVVIRYCQHTSQRRIRHSDEMPQRSEQEALSTFCTRPEQGDTTLMAERVYQNRQRTSTRGGILKAEAALRFAPTLRSFGVEHLQDVPNAMTNDALEAELRLIPGQTSGISIQYFWMLAGSEDFVKPDRMVVRFLEAALARPVGISEAVELLRGASRELLIEFPNMSPRLLDYEVWKFQRSL